MNIAKILSLFSLVPVLLFSLPSAKALELPKELNAEDRMEVMRTLGLGTSTKILSNPFSLGGYSGVELGISLEFINIRNLSRLGCQVEDDPNCPNKTRSSEQELRYPRLSLGKGLYNNIDVFMHFTPPAAGLLLSEFGGLVRWSFFEARFLPINLSLVMHGNHINMEDSFSNTTLGSELIAGINVNNFALYFGGGFLNASGRFMAGTDSANPDSVASPNDPAVQENHTVTETVKENHTVVGVSFHFDDLFAAAQIDRYRLPVYSFKVGMRF